MEISTENTAQVRITLSAQDPDLSLPEDTGAILVSTSLRRYALSTLVNNLLEREKAIPFEFLINGRFLKTSIDDYLSEHGLSSETTLSLEYVRAKLPPTHVASFEHDDWVSSIDVLSATSPAVQWSGKGDVQIPPGQAQIVSGCYDGIVRVWSGTSGEMVAQSKPQSLISQAIKTVKFLTPTRIVSGGNDRVIRLWKYDGANNTTGGSDRSIAPQVEFYGHSAGIETVSVHAPSSRILSASSDGTVGLWTTKVADAPEAPEALLPGAASQSANKRRTLNSQANVSQRGPLRILKSHSDVVSAAAFSEKDSTVGYSASWDHTLVTWDLETAQVVSSRRTTNSLFCLTELKELGLLVTGTGAKTLLAVDPRVDAKSVASLTLRGHTNTVVSAAPEPGIGKMYGLVSGSHDGTCRVWDLRSVRSEEGGSLNLVGTGQVCESTFVLKRESLGGTTKKIVAGDGIKVFGVAWDADIGIVSGAEDKRVQVNQP
jgi:WD40 repeat protein